MNLLTLGNSDSFIVVDKIVKVRLDGICIHVHDVAEGINTINYKTSELAKADFENMQELLMEI